LRLVFYLNQRHHPHHLVPPKVYHLDSNSSMLAGLEGEGDGAPHLLQRLGVNLGLKRPLEFLPRLIIAGEEGLADVEGLGVVIGV
jgi:hypothetical protein